MKKVLSIGLAMLAFFPMCVGAKELFVDSPNGKISVTVSIDSVIAWRNAVPTLSVRPIPKL